MDYNKKGSKMKNILILLFMSLAMIACGGKDDKKDSSSKSGNNGWTKEQRSVFLENCWGGMTDILCPCYFDEFSKVASYEEYMIWKNNEGPKKIDADEKTRKTMKEIKSLYKASKKPCRDQNPNAYSDWECSKLKDQASCMDFQRICNWVQESRECIEKDF